LPAAGALPLRSLVVTLQLLLALAGVSGARSVHAIETAALDIKRLTLEELMSIDVYSASRRAEPVQGVPSAVFVLTNEEIRRSGVTNIPDALRLVPGVNVARVDGNKWGVSIRGNPGGFAGSAGARTSNKLLVLVDGRSIYDPLFGGTFWESQDTVLADIDRIEVIRGPGGSLWGANAVNGIINIITRHARETQGALVGVAVGTEERAAATARYGWQPRTDQHARVYAKTLERDTGFAPDGNPHDALEMYRAGFRWDWDQDARDTLRVSGDWFGANAEQRASTGAAQDVDHRGGNLLTRWERRVSRSEALRLQFYYDHFEFDAPTLGEKRDTYDIELQHDLVPHEKHRLIWGLGYRDTRDDIRAANNAIDPARRNDATASAFVQDTIALIPEQLNLTLGTKFEHNDYSGNEWQPSTRLAWTLNEREMWWAAASRAVRVPTRLDADLFLGGVRLGDGVVTEKVYAYELGHRRLVTPELWLDVAAFRNEYRELVTIETGTLFRNRMHGHTYGLEIAARWKARPAWQLDAAYTYLKMNFDVDADSIATTQPAATEQSNPNHQLVLRSALDVSDRLEFDTTLRHVDELPALQVPAYTALDLGLTWLATPGLEVSLVGQNLLDSHHPEQQVVANGAATEVERGYYAKLRWRF
jgi:iron complex outermembrane receptor protein